MGNEEGLTIRPASPGEADRLMVLARRSEGAPVWPRQIYECLCLPGGSFSPLEATQNFRRLCLVAERNGSLQGFAVVATLSGEPATLESIVVDPGCRKQGIGSALLRATANRAREAGAEALALEVRASNLTALRFYAQEGFQAMGRRPGYYSFPAEDGLLLELPLKSL